MFLFVDKIISINDRHSIRGQFHICSNNPYLYLNQDNQYELPLSIVGEAIGQLCGWYVAKFSKFDLMAVAGVVRGINSFALPLLNDCLELEVSVSSLDLQSRRVCYSGQAYVNGKRILSIEESLAPLVEAVSFKEKNQVMYLYKYLLAGIRDSKHYNVVDYQKCFQYDEMVCKHNATIEGRKEISKGLICFSDHFPCRPVYPLSLLLQNKLELGVELMKKFYGKHTVFLEQTIINQVKIADFINPGDVISTHCESLEINHNYRMQFKTFKEDTRIATAVITFQGD